MARLPTTVGQGSKTRVPVPRVISPRFSNPGLEAAVDVVNKLGDLAWKKMTDAAQIKGQEAGSAAGGQFNELGEPIAPNLEDIDRTTPYGAAFFQSAASLYQQNMRNAGRAKFATMVEQSRGNKAKFDELALPYIEGAVENVPEELLPFVQSDLKEMYDLGAVDVMSEGNVLANKEAIAQFNSDMEGSVRDAEKMITLGQPHRADAIVERINSRYDEMVASGLVLRGDANLAKQSITDRLMAHTAVIEVRSALGRGDIPQALRAVEAIQMNPNLPTEARDAALSAAQSEIGIWTSHRNLRKTAKAAETKAAQDAYRVNFTSQYIKNRTWPMSPEQLLADIEAGRAPAQWGESQIYKMMADEEAAAKLLHEGRSRRMLNEWRYGPRKTLTAGQLQSMTQTDRDTYYSEHSSQIKRQRAVLSGMNETQLEIAIKHMPNEFSPTAIHEELAKRVASQGDDHISQEAANKLLKLYHSEADARAKENKDIAKFNALLQSGLGHEATQGDVDGYVEESGLRVSNPRNHPGFYHVTAQTGTLPTRVRDAFKKVGHIEDEQSAKAVLDMFTYLDDTVFTRAAMESSVGKQTVTALREMLGTFRRTGSVRDAQETYQKMTSEVLDSSSADRREATAWPSEDVGERIDFMQSRISELLQENQGVMDEFLYNTFGWGNKFIADVVRAHAESGADFDKDIMAFPPEILEEIYERTNTKLRLGPSHGGTDSFETAIAMSIRDTMKEWSPVYEASDIRGGRPAITWEKHGISIGSDTSSNPPHIRQIWNANIPKIDAKFKLMAAGAPIPAGYDNWMKVPLHFSSIPSTIGQPGGAAYEVMYEDEDGTHRPILVAAPGQDELVPLAYQWDYRGTVWQAASDKWVKDGADASVLTSFFRAARGDTEGFLGFFERSVGPFDEFFTMSGPTREITQGIVAAGQAEKSYFDFINRSSRKKLIDEQGNLITDAPALELEQYGLENYATFSLR